MEYADEFLTGKEKLEVAGKQIQAYQMIHTFEPFTGTQVLTGALLLHKDKSVSAIAVRKLTPIGNTKFKNLTKAHQELLQKNKFPWEIGPQIKVSAQWYTIPEKWYENPNWNFEDWFNAINEKLDEE